MQNIHNHISKCIPQWVKLDITQNYTNFRRRCLPRSGNLFKMFLVGMLEEDVMFWQNGRTEKKNKYLS
jgi:hypothetical protein